MTPGTRFGPYRIERRLGVGGMAETFVASRDLGVGSLQRVCLKRMLPGLLGDRELVRAFEREAQLAADLVHTNIAAMIDFGIVGGAYFIALELIDGLDLRQLLHAAKRRDERLPHELVLEIAFSLGHALEYAHAVGRDGIARGVVHRDISPSNVLLGRHGEVKLADFGIAKFAGASHHTKTGMLKGKLPYLPPEYIVGGEYDTQGDLFALGVTLFECMVGARPFDGANHAETMQRITEGRRHSLQALLPETPARLVEAVEWLLSNDPDDRPATAREWVVSLHAIAPAASARNRLAKAVSSLCLDPSGSAPEPHTVAIAPKNGDDVAELAEAGVAGPDDITRTRPTPANDD